MKKILNFTLDTPINSFQYLAYSSGILLADKNDRNYQWLISHCLRIYHNNSNLCIYLPGEGTSLFNELKGSKNDCFVRYHIDLPVTYAECNPKDLLGIIKEMIDYGFYLHGFYNEYYINNKNAYHKYNFVHDYLISGYDDTDRLFYIPGYTDQHVYQMIPVPFDNYIDALKYDNESNGHLCLNFYKINKNYEFRFDTEFAKRSVKEFNHSADYSDYRDKNLIYGKEALKYFAKEDLEDEDKYVQNIKAFSDYMNCFVSFIENLIHNKIIQKEELFKNAVTNHKNCKFLAFMALKFLSTNDPKILDKINKIKNESIDNIIEVMRLLENKL